MKTLKNQNIDKFICILMFNVHLSLCIHQFCINILYQCIPLHNCVTCLFVVICQSDYMLIKWLNLWMRLVFLNALSLWYRKQMCNSIMPQIHFSKTYSVYAYCSHIFQKNNFNTLRHKQNRWYFADVSTCIFLNDNCCILIQILLNYVPKGPVDNKPALVQIMAWHWMGNKPLSKPMMA